MPPGPSRSRLAPPCPTSCLHAVASTLRSTLPAKHSWYVSLGMCGTGGAEHRPPRPGLCMPSGLHGETAPSLAPSCTAPRRPCRKARTVDRMCFTAPTSPFLGWTLTANTGPVILRDRNRLVRESGTADDDPKNHKPGRGSGSAHVQGRPHERPAECLPAAALRPSAIAGGRPEAQSLS